MLSFLETEQDASCKRNAFMMLIHADQDKALEYLSSCIDQVSQKISIFSHQRKLA